MTRALQKVLVVGGSMIGTASVKALLAQNVQVRLLASRALDGLDAPPGMLQMVQERYEHADPQAMLDGVDGVLLGSVRVSAAVADFTLETRRALVQANERWCAAMEKSGKPLRVAFCSSASLYPPLPRCVREDESIVPDESHYYSRAMHDTEQALSALSERTGARVSCVNLRYFNVYGQHTGEFVSMPQRLMHVALHEEPITLHGDGSAVRDYVHVQDVVRANLLALRGDAQGAVNIGSGVGTSLKELAQAVESISGKTLAVTYDDTLDAGVPYSVADVTTAQTRLGFSSAISLTEGLVQLHAVLRARGNG
jgi:UDP-glucose 4-epimerase